MTCADKWIIGVNIVVAFGTIMAVIVALFGDWFRNRIFKVQISAEILNKNGELTSWTNSRKQVIYYHLKIKKSHSSIIVHKCRVLLKSIAKKNPDQSYDEMPLAVPTTYQWAPANTSPPAIDFINEQILDFGYIEEGSDRFIPAVNPLWNNFNGFLKANETMIYRLEILANNSKPHNFCVEVYWDGKWNNDLKVMSNSFKIRIL